MRKRCYEKEGIRYVIDFSSTVAEEEKEDSHEITVIIDTTKIYYEPVLCQC